MIQRLLSLLTLFPTLLFFAQARPSRVPEGFRADLTLQAVKDRAFEAQMPYLVYFQESGKIQAKRMLKHTWQDEDVREIVENNFLAVTFDPFDQGEQVGLIQQHQVYGFPSLLIFSPEGQLLGKSEGYLAPETMEAILLKHLSLIEYKLELMAMSGLQSRGLPSEPAPRGIEAPQLTPPLLVGSMNRFAVRDATARNASIRDLTPISHISDLYPESLTSPDPGAAGSDAPSMVSRSGPDDTTPETPVLEVATQDQIVMELPGLEEYGLDRVSIIGTPAIEAFGLLVGSFLSFEETQQEVHRFERLWRDRIFVYAEEVNGTLVYRVILGEYQSKDTADAFSLAIYRMEGINPTVILLNDLLK